MIIVPDKFVFLATPRTASRAISEALLRKYPNAITDYPKNHHDPAPDDCTLPQYTIIRNPYDQLLSWWSHLNYARGRRSRQTPVEFARTYENIMFLPKHDKYRLNIHAEMADKFIPYTNTLSIIANYLELKDLEYVGRRRRYTPTPTEEKELWQLLDKEFTADIRLWITRKIVVSV